MSIHVSVTFDGHFFLSEDEIWPEGVPEGATRDDAMRKIESIDAIDLISEWNLVPEVTTF